MSNPTCRIVFRLYHPAYRDKMVGAVRAAGGIVDPEGNPTTIWAVVPPEKVAELVDLHVVDDYISQ